MIPNNEKPDVCGPCGGRCCKKMPGGAVPADFGTTRQAVQRAVQAALDSGKWSIDWWDGDPRPQKHEVERGPFVRPATVQGQGQLGDPSWGGTCCMLTPKGCSLPWDQRPTTCQRLVPVGPGECSLNGFEKDDLALAWETYWPWLEGLLGDEDYTGSGFGHSLMGGLFGFGYDYDDDED